jgi:hypothetical protein
MLLITVLLNYGTLAKLILAKLASKNRMPGFMRHVVSPFVVNEGPHPIWTPKSLYGSLCSQWQFHANPVP